MKTKKFAGNVLFWLTLVSPIISFGLASIIGETNIFGIAGIVRYSWIMWFFIPFGILSLLIGRILKRKNQKYKKNYIIALVCLPLLLIFGSYRFIFSSFSYDTSSVFAVEQTSGIALPKQIKVATHELKQYTISYVKIVDNNEEIDFETKIKSSSIWKQKLNLETKGLLPIDIQMEMSTFDSFILYNVTNDKYNDCPLSGEYEFIFVAYDYETQRLIIISDYVVCF